MQQLLSYIESIVKLSDDAREAINKYAQTEHYLKNSHILEAGERCNKIWFVKKGMVRKYHYHNGKEITTWIHVENEIFTALRSYGQQVPSDEYIQSCEDTEVISISRQNSEKLSRYHQIVTFTNLLMERMFISVDVNTKALNQKDAKGKYEYLNEIAPEIIKRAKLGHIASLLGITQETLSRIRK